MTTVAIVPVTSAGRVVSYQAVAGCRVAEGNTEGAALDALGARFPEVVAESLVVIQRFRPDEFFSASQQLRLQDLMQRWRAARDGGDSLTADEESELAALIQAELDASARRAAATAEVLGR